MHKNYIDSSGFCQVKILLSCESHDSSKINDFIALFSFF